MGEKSKGIGVLFGTDQTLKLCWLTAPVFPNFRQDQTSTYKNHQDWQTVQVLRKCDLDVRRAEELIEKHGQMMTTDPEYDSKAIFNADPPPDNFNGSIYIYTHSIAGYKRIHGEHSWWNTTKTKDNATKMRGI